MCWVRILSRADNLEVMSEDEVRKEELVAAQGNIKEDVVPLEDALIMDDSKAKRGVIMDVLMSGETDNYIPSLNKARENRDVEVAHYASTAMAELSRNYELELQRYSSLYNGNKGDVKILDEYINFLEQYLNTGMVEGRLLEINRGILRDLLVRVKLIIDWFI